MSIIGQLWGATQSTRELMVNSLHQQLVQLMQTTEGQHTGIMSLLTTQCSRLDQRLLMKVLGNKWWIKLFLLYKCRQCLGQKPRILIRVTWAQACSGRVKVKHVMNLKVHTRKVLCLRLSAREAVSMLMAWLKVCMDNLYQESHGLIRRLMGIICFLILSKRANTRFMIEELLYQITV